MEEGIGKGRLRPCNLLQSKKVSLGTLYMSLKAMDSLIDVHVCVCVYNTVDPRLSEPLWPTAAKN